MTATKVTPFTDDELKEIEHIAHLTCELNDSITGNPAQYEKFLELLAEFDDSDHPIGPKDFMAMYEEAKTCVLDNPAVLLCQYCEERPAESPNELCWTCHQDSIVLVEV